MRVTQAFRFELDPGRAARVALAKHVGAARLAHNCALRRCLQALSEGRTIPAARGMHREWNCWKRQPAPRWVEVSKWAPQEALRDLDRAFRNWRQGRARRPRFKPKSLDDNTARFTGPIKVFPCHVQLPRIGQVRTKERTEKLPALLAEGKARILSATVAREADRWCLSLTCEAERPNPPLRHGEPVGLELGPAWFLVLSEGMGVDAPTPLAKALRLLRRRSPQLSGKQRKGSRSHARASLRPDRLHRRIRNIRRDFLH